MYKAKAVYARRYAYTAFVNYELKWTKECSDAMACLYFPSDLLTLLSEYVANAVHVECKRYTEGLVEWI